jgi:hypothetical protein
MSFLAEARDRERWLSFSAESYLELWTAQHTALAELRGCDAGDPRSDASDHRPILRTINADVLQLAGFWHLALIKAEHYRRTSTSSTLATLALDVVKRQWRAALLDVEAKARPGTPNDRYPRNLEFWRASATVAVAIAAIDNLPLAMELAVSDDHEAAPATELTNSDMDPSRVKAPQ